MAVGESKSAEEKCGVVDWHKLQWRKYLVNTVGAMQHTSKKFYIRIMKKLPRTRPHTRTHTQNLNEYNTIQYNVKLVMRHM